jgi:PAS domain S-box-containing protein
MKKNISKFYSFLFKKTEDLPLENKIFRLVTFGCGLTSFLSLVTNLFSNLPILLNFALGLCGTIFFIFYHLSFRKKNYKPLIIPLYIICLLILSYSWFFTQGIEGSITYYFFLVIPLIVFLNYNEKYFITLFIFILIAAGLIIIQISFPSIVIPYPNETSHELDLTISFISTLFILGIALIWFKKNLENERKKNQCQKNEIEQKNDELQKAILWKDSIINNNAAGVCVLNKDMIIVEINDRFAEILGYNKEKLTGEKIENFYNSTLESPEGKSFNEAFNDEITNEDRFKADIPFTKSDNHIVWCKISSTVIDKNDLAKGYICVFLDITAQKKVEQALAESQEQYRQLIENQGEGIGIVDPDENFTFVNPAGENIFETPHGRLVNLNLKDFVVPDQIPMMLEETAKRTQAIKSTYEIGIITYKGKKRYILVTATPQFDKEGRFKGTFGIFRDITERKKMEEKLQKQQEELQTMIDAVPAWIFYKDKKNRFIRVNKVFADIMRMPKEQLEGKSLFDLYPKQQAEAFWNDDKEVMKTGKPKMNIVESVEIEGKTRWVQTDKIPYFDEGNNIIGVICFAVDITERLNLKENVDNYINELERSNNELEQFANIIAHDLQSPLKMISGFTHLLDQQFKDKPDKNLEEITQYVNTGVSKMQSLIKDLLFYSKVHSQSKEIDKVTLNDVVRQVVLILNESIQKKKAVITFDTMPVISANEVQMIQIFQNLIDNAIKFCTVEPKIHITSKEEKNQWLFSVSDNGIGIDKNHFDNIFQIFQKLNPDEKYSGTGIGLAICKRIVERHGGKIWVKSEMGKGCTFYFTVSKMIEKSL